MGLVLNLRLIEEFEVLFFLVGVGDFYHFFGEVVVVYFELFEFRTGLK